ncbi:MAG TPA: tetratricopeptide repeat protein [Steroidobacteraceae bacterium]
MKRAAQVAADALQPTVAATVAARWISLDPGSLDAQRAAARAALALHRIGDASAHYRVVLTASPAGTDTEFANLETELNATDNIFGARQVADRLASSFPASKAALRLQGATALRADDPAAAVRSLTAALAMPDASGKECADTKEGARTNGADGTDVAGGKDGKDGKGDSDAAQQELAQTLLRARVLAGDIDGPLAQAQATVERTDTAANRLDYALLLMTAQRNAAATAQLEILARQPEPRAVALRLLGLIEFQDGHFDTAARRFTELLTTGKYLDDAFYYLALIADRHDDSERALRLYAQVQNGEYVVPALLRASVILHTHGGTAAADELLDRLVEDEPQRAPEILNARARMYADSGDAPRALAVLKRGIAEYPDSVDLRYGLASTYDDEGQVGAALRELTALVKARPDDPAALNALGYTLADHGRELTRARKLIGRAYAAAPKNAAFLDSLGWVLFRQGHGAEALPYLTAAYADDRGGDIAAHLGEVLWRLGKTADAERIWSEAGVLDADNRLLKATRQRLHATPQAARMTRQPAPATWQAAPTMPQPAPL